MHSKRSFQRKLYEGRWPEGRELIPPLPTAHPALEPGVIHPMPCSLCQLPHWFYIYKTPPHARNRSDSIYKAKARRISLARFEATGGG
jgi:hypothetical protein